MVIKDELLYTVDENNEPQEPVSRKLSHQHGIWHRTCQIWVVNDKQQVLCQRRSLLKDMNPGKWEAIFGGHLAPGQEYVDCAMAELKEELGIHIEEKSMTFLFTHKSEKDTEFQGIFYVRWNGNVTDLRLEKEEVEEVMWIPIKDLEDIFTKKHPNLSSFGYEEKLLRDLLLLFSNERSNTKSIKV